MYKARWQLKIISPTGVPRNALIQEINKYLNESKKVSYSHTYIEALADILILVDSGKGIRTFYNLINKKLYVNVSPECDLTKLYEVIEESGGLTLTP